MCNIQDNCKIVDWYVFIKVTSLCTYNTLQVTSFHRLSTSFMNDALPQMSSD